MRTLAAVALLALAGAAPALAQNPVQRCSHETFPVEGRSLAVTVCAGAPDAGKSVAVTETFKYGAASSTHKTSIESLNGATTRGVDDAPLAAIGLNYTLHLTLAYRDAAVSIEHAMLLPGAIPLK